MSIWSRTPTRPGSLLLLSLALLACGTAVPPHDTLRFLLATDALSLDPRQATDATSERVQRLLYRALVDFDPQFRPVPGMAHWQQLSQTHYRFILDAAQCALPGGGRLDAHDVAATYRALLDPANASPHRQLLSGIRQIDVPDADTVDFHLQAPDALFTSYLNIGIMPAARPGGSGGSGSYTLTTPPTPGRVLLRRADDGLALEFLTVKDPTVRVLKLLSGEADLLQGDLPFELWGYLRRQPGIQVVQQSGNNFSYLGFNLRDPITGQLVVRQAIAHAIDREAIIRYLFQGAARPAAGILPPAHWAVDPALHAPDYDPARARVLLAALGYSPEHPLKLRFKTSSDPFRLRLATVYQAQLAEVGIALEVQSYDWGTFYADIKAGRFQIFSLTWTGVKTPDIYTYAFHSQSLPPQGANRGHYQNPVLDALLAQAKLAPDAATQVGIYHQVQALLLADLPYVPLWYEDYLAAYGPRLTGYSPGTSGTYDRLQHVRYTP